MEFETAIPNLRLRKISTQQKPTTLSTRSEEIEEPVTPAGRLFSQPNFKCYILCTLGFKDPINVSGFKETLLETLVKHKRFHSIMIKDRRGVDVWVPVEVDINAHVFEPTGYTESEMAAPRFVEDYLSDIGSAPPMDVSRPLWECHLLNGTSGNANSHMIIRVHHSLGDGTSLMSLLLACTRRLDSPGELPSIPVAKRRKREKGSLFVWLLSMIVLLWNTLVGVFLFTSTAIWLKDSHSVLKGYEGVEKKKKKLVYQIIDIGDMRLVKDAVNGTINDVLMGMVGAGLLRYLESKKNAGSKIENLRIRAAGLMNTRGSPGLQELASMMEGGSQMRWGNHLGYLLIDIPLKHLGDPLEHIVAAKKIGDKKKTSLEGIFTYWSGAMLMGMTGPVPPTILTRRIILQTTLAVSNVPGPMDAVTFSGNPIVSIYPAVVGHPQSLSIFLQSYMGKASLVVMSAEDIIPDPEVICQHCVDSLQDMVKSTRQKRIQLGK